MNGGEVVVCDSCEQPFEILQEYYQSGVTCPYCGEPNGAGVNEVDY